MKQHTSLIIIIAPQAPHAIVGAEVGVGVTALELLTKMKKRAKNEHGDLNENDPIMLESSRESSLEPSLDGTTVCSKRIDLICQVYTGVYV
jgi:hypothetical protein